MLPWSAEMSGRIDEHEIDSASLRGNPLGDPHLRPLWVHVPPHYDEARVYPVVYVIQGYTGLLTMWRNRSAFRQPVIELFDQVLADPDVPDVLVAYVDAWTAYGGSQFVDSPGTGRYHSYLCGDVVAYVDQRYATLSEPRHRAIMGKSSGGFGAMVTPMLRPDLFGALATHAGDALYEHCYAATFAEVVRALRDYDGDIWRWWGDFRSRVAFTKPEDTNLLVTLGVAACFSADEDGTVHLPFDPMTGRLIPEQWQRWLDWDPVRMLEVPAYAEAVSGLRAVWIDAGVKDEWYLDLGAQAFRDGLRRIGLPDERIAFELFDAGHGAIEYRYPLALRWLAERISTDG
jgi:S-formylglutathione hydrolase FrmB